MGAIHVKEGNGSGVGADYLRCNRCGYLDRSDFMARRFQETRRACRKCGCSHIIDNFKMVSDEEWERIAKGFYDYYKERSDRVDAPVGPVAFDSGSAAT